MKPLYRSPAAAARIMQRYRKLLDCWLVPCQRHQLDTSEGSTFVVECGEARAPVVALLHGSMSNAATWLPEAEALAPHFRVLAIDMIGEPGLSAPSRPPLESDRYAHWLDEVFDALGVSRAQIVGISLGGWLGFDYAIRRPARVEKLAAIVPGGIGAQKSVLPWAAPLMLLGPFGAKIIRQRIMGPPPPAPTATMRMLDTLLTDIRKQFRPRVVQLPIFSDAQLAALPMPVLGIVAGRDVMLDPVSMRQRLTDHIPNGTVLYLPEARHYPGLQIDPILNFLLS